MLMQKHQSKHSLHVMNQRAVVHSLKLILLMVSVDSIEVIKTGVGYGFDPADTFCPKEQYAVLVIKVGLQQHVNDGEYIRTSYRR